MLSVLAILRAYATCDAEGIEALIKDAPAWSDADLLAFTVMLVEYHTGRPATDYIDQMCDGVVKLHIEEMARAN
jgi:hypothetical protein